MRMLKSGILNDPFSEREYNRPVCSKCMFYDFNEMSDEAYCAAKDYEPIKLYRKHRPNWCLRLEK